MEYWYGYTGNNLIAVRGSAVCCIMPDESLKPLLKAAERHYVRYARHIRLIPTDTFKAALVAPLAVQEYGAPDNIIVFSSVGQLLDIFADIDIETAAINLLNGQVASAYAGDAEDAAIQVM